MSLATGVDSHEDSFAIVVVDSIGKEVDRFCVDNSSVSFDDAVKPVRRHGKAVWGIEGTGAYARLFADYLCAARLVVYEVPGRLTKRHRSSDRIDSNDVSFEKVGSDKAVLTKRRAHVAEIVNPRILDVKSDAADRISTIVAHTTGGTNVRSAESKHVWLVG